MATKSSLRAEKIRVFIVDDHAILRSGLTMLINAQTDMVVAAEAKDGNEALAKISEINPDVTLMDISMPGLNGLKAIQQIIEICPHTRVLVLSMHDDPSYLRLVLTSGGLGYVMKKSADTELLSAIRSVVEDKVFIDPSMAYALVQDIVEKRTARPRRELLSKREREALILLAQGYTNQEVADRLAVSVKTAETYRARLTKKLGLRSRAELIRYALQMGLLTPEEHTLMEKPPDAK